MRSLPIAILALAIGPRPAGAVDEPPACRLAAGLALVGQGQPEAAMGEIAAALHAGVASADLAWLTLGRAQVQLGRPVEALDSARRAERAVRESVRGGESLALEARAFEALGDDAAAARAWAAAASRAADASLRVEAAVARAEALERAGDWGGAMRAWRALALHDAGRSPADALERGRAAAARGGIAFQPTAEQLMDRARDLAAAGHHERAVAACREVESAARGTALATTAAYRRARSHYQLKANEEAAAACRAVLAAAPSSEVRDGSRLVLARVAWRNDDGPGLLAATEPALRDPARLAMEWADDLLHVRGGYEQEQGRHDEAVRVFDLQAATFPRSELAGDARFKAAWSRWLQGRFEEAGRRWDEASASGSAELSDAAAYWAGRAWERAGRADLATARFRELAARRRFGYHGQLAREALSAHVSAPDLAAWDAAAEAEAVVFRAPPAPRAETPLLERYLELSGAGLFGEALDEIEAEWSTARRSDALAFELCRARSLTGRAAAAQALLSSRFGAALEKPSRASDRALWEIVHPRPFAALVDREAARHGVEPALACAVIRSESWWDPRALSGAGARGLMQLVHGTAVRIARSEGIAAPSPEDLFRPEVNVALGTRYLRDLLDEFDGDVAAAVAAYNAGEDKVAAWWDGFARAGVSSGAERVQRIPYRETRAYVKRVLEEAAWYRWLASPPGTGAPAAAGATGT